MVRKMTPAQFKVAVNKAQRQQKQAIDSYNREVRAYNAKARAHTPGLRTSAAVSIRRSVA